MELLATTAPGVEGILASELKDLGLKVRQSISGGVEFSGKPEDLWRANLWSRVANRVVVRVDEFHANSFHELERRAKKVEWGRFLSSGSPVGFRVTCRKSRLYHSDAVAERLQNAALKVTNAIAVKGEQDDEEESPGQLFIVRVANDVVTISADSSGALLHRRGYRQAIAKAPLRETLAAAMLIGSKWDRKSPLADPMCGSGTIPIEAAMMARNIAPGIQRSFAFETWSDHDADKWRELKAKASEGESDRAPGVILASDRDGGAVTAANENAVRARVRDDLDIQQKAISDVEFPEAPGWIVSNPPYGLRVGESDSLRNLYSRLGAILRRGAAGYELALLSADRALEAQLKLNLNEVFRTNNGGIPVRLVTA
jgi:putative N6-adenine-specific DNA methylase